MAYTEAQGRANRKYRNKAYDRLEIFMEKGGKQKIKAAADAAGMSINKWLNTIIDEKLNSL